MRHVEKEHLRKFCKTHELDPMEIDSSITYWENKAHLKSLVPNRDLDQLGQLAQERYEAQVESSHTTGTYHKGAICPKCSKQGSGLHSRWVLNEQKRRYEPYYYFAHSVKINGAFKVQWHYIAKAQAIEILSNTWISEQYSIRQTP